MRIPFMRNKRKMHFPAEIFRGHIEIRAVMTPKDFDAGRLPNYEIQNVLGENKDPVANIYVSRTTEGYYSIKRRFNIPGRQPTTIGFAYSLKDADEAAQIRTYQTAVRLADGQFPIKSFVKEDIANLEGKLRKER